MKRCSTSLIIREMQIKTTMRHHTCQNAIIKKTNAGEGVEKREPSCTVGGDVNWCSHRGKQYAGSSRNSKQNYYMSQQFHSWHRSEKNKNTNLKRYMYPNFHSSTIYNSQDMETTQVSINRRTGKEDVERYTYTYVCTCI